MKRGYFLLSIVMAAAIALFGAYLVLMRNIKDIRPPVISVDEKMLEISVKDDKAKLMTGITAMDDRDGDVTASLLVESIYGISNDNVTTVTYAAFDRAGNVSKIERQVRYTDYHEPRLQLSGSLCFPYNSGFDLLDYVGAEDVLEGDIRRRVRATLVSDTRSINEIGSHVVRLHVTNSLGDTVEMDFPVEVYDPEWYTASVKLDEYLIYLKKDEVFRPEEYLKGFSIRGEETDISRGVPNSILCDINSNVNTSVPGIYRVKYTLTQSINMTAFSGQAILVVIVQE